MDVVWHDHEGMQKKAIFRAVLLEDLEEQVRVRVDLKESTAIRGNSRYEESTDFLWCDGHEVQSKG